jgi:hypothetical protein
MVYVLNAKQITPTMYDQILDRIAGGELVTTVVKDYGVSRQMLWRYAEACLKDTHGLDAYTRARIAQAHSMAEDIISIADDTTIEPEHKRIMVDSRKWLTSKLASRIYGDPTRHVELTGANGGSIQVEDVGQLRDTLTARLAGIASRRKLLTATATIVAEDTVDAEIVEPDETA